MLALGLPSTLTLVQTSTLPTVHPYSYSPISSSVPDPCSSIQASADDTPRRIAQQLAITAKELVDFNKARARVRDVRLEFGCGLASKARARVRDVLVLVCYRDAQV